MNSHKATRTDAKRRTPRMTSKLGLIAAAGGSLSVEPHRRGWAVVGWARGWDRPVVVDTAPTEYAAHVRLAEWRRRLALA
jgi:hypothetical protein